ncbi:putative F-box and associated interaction domains-containing protein [Tripterygium wilfordii]|uniref:Putative F-box and associated interaction domains-containing protein n=1 Tax=Tripterygium wilfordii TaxID=458696 RepID=A0A7J7BX89_TRIWF|nr:F-box protein At3g07870-like [Tripterygium wilfordii]KAF5726492.1 putative F-box and associated interaction domains-containing protein [Tripterygium wilfordii]
MDSDSGRSGKKRRTQLEDDDPQTTGMERLPTDIVIDILLRLPITSLVQFKLVCRGWRILSQNPQFPNIHLSFTSENDPCLILHCDFPIRNQLHFLDFSAEDDKKDKVKRLHTPFQAKMPEFDVVGSCNGLLCLSDSLFNEALYLYNPFTTNYVELPKSIQYPHQEVVFGFGFSQKTKEYKVVKVVYYRNGHSSSYQRSRRMIYTQSEVQILTLGSSSWRSLGKVPYQLVRRQSEALVNGRLHWASRPRRFNPARRIISFDLADERFLEVQKPDCGGLNRCNYHLAVLRGCLSAAVYCNYGRLEIWVMKEYNVKESWVKEFNVGSYVPKGLKQNVEQPFKNWKNGSNGRVVRVLCQLKNGEILLEYKNRVLASYDPKQGKFRDLVFQGTPNWFQTVVHMGSLNWIDTPCST